MGELTFRALPKVELHVHLDCSLSFDVISKIDPDIDHDVFLNEFIAPPKCSNLAHFLTFANRQIVLMQTEQGLRMAVKDVIRQLKQDNVLYAEIRFSPHLHTLKGLTAYEVVSIVDSETQKWATKWDIEIGLLLCTLRHYSKKQSLETVKLADFFKDRQVCGFDIAGDEAGYPLTNHIEAFNYAKKHQIPITCHAGEARGADSVEETLQLLNPSRIGHGVRSIEKEETISELSNQSVHLEICPSTNIQVGVFKTFQDHPIDEFMKKNMSLSINTDTRTITNTNLNREYLKIHQTFGWTAEDFKKTNLDALNAAFLAEVRKKSLQQMINEGYAGKVLDA